MLRQSFVYQLRAGLAARVSRNKWRDEYMHDRLMARFHDVRGIAFGEVHGVYAAPDFVGSFVRASAQSTRAGLFFCEMLPASLQPAVDAWQYRDQDEPLFSYFNARTRAFAARQFEFYARMFYRVRESGVRIVAIDTDDDYHTACSKQGLRERNDHWIARINHECQYGARRGEKFILYAGQGHVIPGFDRQESVARRLNIPAFLLETGKGHRLVPLNRSHDLSVVVVPHHAEQDPRMNAPVLRTYGDIRQGLSGVSAPA